MGRLSTYTEEIASEICERLTTETLRQICTSEHIPAISTILQWVADRPEFAARYARARGVQLELMAEDIQSIADDLTEDPNSRRVRVDSRKWLLSKLRPDKYGDTSNVNLRTPEGISVTIRNTVDPK